ncbi:MAG: SRPBCC family protein [Streptosporangiaceae bacterium]
MPKSYASAVIGSSPERVWELVRDFNGLGGWLPAVERSEIENDRQPDQVGAIRHLTLGDGGVVRERLLVLDDAERSYTYEILESPFAVRRYFSTIRVAPVTDSGRTFVEWWGEYDCESKDDEELDKTFARGVYGSGLSALKERFG